MTELSVAIIHMMGLMCILSDINDSVSESHVCQVKLCSDFHTEFSKAITPQLREKRKLHYLNPVACKDS